MHRRPARPRRQGACRSPRRALRSRSASLLPDESRSARCVPDPRARARSPGGARRATPPSRSGIPARGRPARSALPRRCGASACGGGHAGREPPEAIGNDARAVHGRSARVEDTAANRDRGLRGNRQDGRLAGMHQKRGGIRPARRDVEGGRAPPAAEHEHAGLPGLHVREREPALGVGVGPSGVGISVLPAKQAHARARNRPASVGRDDTAPRRVRLARGG